jgi:hypothetical protein
MRDNPNDAAAAAFNYFDLKAEMKFTHRKKLNRFLHILQSFVGA